jgi:hypothetical protein
MASTASSFMESLGQVGDVEALIDQPETLYFDAKTLKSEALTADSDRNSLAKQVSGFANADGGVVIYGLSASRDTSGRDLVNALQPLSDVKLVASKILGLIGQFLQPPVEGIRVETRARIDGKGYVLVFVPPSDSGPHRSSRNREYYRRHGSATLPMEHYEIEEAFGRRRRPQLELYFRIKERRGNRPSGYHAAILIGMRNVGRGIAKYPGMLLKDARVSSYGVDGNHAFGLTPVPTSSPIDLRYGGALERAIYPDDELDVTTIAHPIEVIDVIGANDYCRSEDLRVAYHLFAEDMKTITGELSMSAQEIKVQMASIGYP